MEKLYVDEKEVSKMTGISLGTLRNYRARGRGIGYVKIGKSVRYDVADVVNFMEERKIRHSENGGA